MNRILQSIRFGKKESQPSSTTTSCTTLSSSSSSTTTTTTPSNVDGCSDGCTIGCLSYPESVMEKIEYDDDIKDSVKGYDRQIIVLSGVSENEWSARIDDEKGSYALLLSDAMRKAKDSMKININTSTDNSVDSDGKKIDNINTAKKADLIIYPDMIKLHGVTVEQFPKLTEYFASGKSSEWLQSLIPSSTSSSSSSSSPSSIAASVSALSSLGISHSVLNGVHFLICAHMKRDSRCGITAPILLQQFNEVCKQLNIPSNQVYFHKISHVGGHKVAANTLVYPFGYWFGKVKPEHAEPLIRTFVINQGKGIENLEAILRGRCRTKVDLSW